MTLVRNTIPNLVNGVSQQAASLRLETQADEQINCYSTVVNGLTKRPPRETLFYIYDDLSASTWSHQIIRSANEQYIVLISETNGGEIRVFDINGTERTVNYPSGNGYLNNPDPRTGYAATTVADYTFIVNRAWTVSMTGSTAPTRPYEALIPVVSGNYGKNYEIFVNGSLVAWYRTATGTGTDADNDSKTVDTTNIASHLFDGSSSTGSDPTESSTDYAGQNLQNDLPAGFNCWRQGNVIHISSNTDFDISTIDGYGNNAMYVIKGSVQRFSDLPEYAPGGYIMRVEGS